MQKLTLVRLTSKPVRQFFYVENNTKSSCPFYENVSQSVSKPRQFSRLKRQSAAYCASRVRLPPLLETVGGHGAQLPKGRQVSKYVSERSTFAFRTMQTSSEIQMIGISEIAKKGLTFFKFKSKNKRFSLTGLISSAEEIGYQLRFLVCFSSM